jgi:ribonucleotide reductase, class II
MVRDIERIRPKDISDWDAQSSGQLNGQFPKSAPAANPVFYRTYSRKLADDRRESWQEVSDRTIAGLAELGQFTAPERALVEKMQQSMRCLPSGRWLWVGGTDWIAKPENFSGSYNCTSTNVTDWRSFGLMMDLAMMGSGTGAVLEPKYTSQLPAIRNRLKIQSVSEIGSQPVGQRQDQTEILVEGNRVTIRVGDSRQGWVASYQSLLELSTDERFQRSEADRFNGEVEINVDLSHVRPAGERLKGFGGVANPVRLPALYDRCTTVLNRAVGRQLTSVECCILIDEAAACVVAGNIRRSAGMRQGSSEDGEFAGAKDNLWQQDAEGNWRIDPDRDVLRMANHTRVYHHQPTEQECIDAVRKQFYSGEGAIQYAPEAIARSNADLLNTPEKREQFVSLYRQSRQQAKDYLRVLLIEQKQSQM